MAELSSIARPYAQAVFELAKDSGHYGPWSEALGFLAKVAADKDMAALFSNPRVSRQQAADIVIELFGEGVGDEPKNLVRLLAQNRRLLALSAISEQYELLRAEAEQTIRAELESALPISDGEQHRIAGALKTRLGRDVDGRYPAMGLGCFSYTDCFAASLYLYDPNHCVLGNGP